MADQKEIDRLLALGRASANPSDEPKKVVIPEDKLRELLESAGALAGALSPTLGKYWPLITAVVLGIAAVAYGAGWITTKSAEPVPIVVTDPIIKAVQDDGGATRKDLKSGFDAVVAAIATNKPVPPGPGPSPSPSVIDIKGPNVADVGRMVILTATAKGEITWLCQPNQGMDYAISGATIHITPTAQGDLWVVAVTVDAGKPIALWWKITAGKGPLPPPGPGPTPDVTPILGDGFRVMLIFDANQTLTQEQQLQRDAKVVRDYLGSKTTPTTDGSKRGWYALDKDVDVSNDSHIWQAALKRPRTSIPWAIISSRKGNYEGPWPSGGAQGMVDLLRKYEP